MANIIAVQGRFEYTDENGVVHQVDAIKGEPGKSAWQYAKDSGLIDDRVTQQEYMTACGKIFQELDRMQRANFTVESIGRKYQQIETLQSQITSAITQVSAATAAANSASAAAIEQANGAAARASEALQAAQSARSCASMASSWATQAQAAANIKVNVNQIGAGQLPYASVSQVTQGTPQTFMTFGLPTMSNAVAGQGSNMYLQSGSTSFSMASGKTQARTLQFSLPYNTGQSPAVAYALGDFYLSTGASLSTWKDMGISDRTPSNFTILLSNGTSGSGYTARISWIALGNRSG